MFWIDTVPRLRVDLGNMLWAEVASGQMVFRVSCVAQVSCPSGLGHRSRGPTPLALLA